MADKLRDRAAAQAAARQSATNGDDTTTPAPGAAVAKRDVAKDLVDAVAPEIAKQLPRQIKPDAFLRVILTGLKNSKQAKQLANCSRPSLWGAMLEAARYGLMPFTDEGAIVPFGDTATFIPQYQGLIQIMFRTGMVSGVTFNLIHQADDWEVEYGTNGRFYHRPRFVDANGVPVDRGDPILAYCYVTLKDGSITSPTFVTRDAAVEVMQTHSRSWQNAERRWQNTNGKYGRDSTWHTEFNSMWLKTSVRQHAKSAPKSPELIELLLAEARDDNRRPDAAPAPTWTPDGGYGRGIDWATDDMNGAVPGEVIHDENEPANEPAGVDEEDGWPDGARAPGTVNLPADPVPGDPEPAIPEEGVKVTRPTAGRIGRIFQQIGWTGDEYAARRLVIAGLMTDLAASPPIALDTPMGMTEQQGQTAERNLLDMLGKAKHAHRDPAEVLQALYDRLTGDGTPVEDPEEPAR